MRHSTSKIKTISDFHHIFNLSKPKHPSISFVGLDEFKNGVKGLKMRLEVDLFVITLRDGSCGEMFDRKPYDFTESVITFRQPNKSGKLDQNCTKASEGWFLVFSLDFIRNTVLYDKIDDFNFFFYKYSEALHLSADEQRLIENCVGLIVKEIDQRIDIHSHGVIISTLVLLFNLCSRFYERQFTTRSVFNTEIIHNVNFILNDYYKEGLLKTFGLPKNSFIAENVNLSSNYLNDLLLKETKKNTKNYVIEFVIEKAKTLLVKTESPIETISQDLGFKILSYFERSFKLNTGMSPLEFRQLFK
ncbi:hypothetical protein BTO06_04290 [Tenacibaculum sp. SZ-18]|uniref:helix-turn-helix domain-containing protein n=1 Tax=Tenacibaculum sp. SZ-18 TaxID=754423 RepID=UPI000C2CED66|nr:response regulator transcription factor [Tenacibaculum sp. SZ-18]AUC14412.1 hypothetical protein BTO06_04290 [Tenacibaculum sp. SZ-18]